MILFFIFCSVAAAPICPSVTEIKNLINFKDVVVEMPFPDYPGVEVFNGVTMQTLGICDQTGALCYNNTCADKQQCRFLSQALLFNLIPTNSSINLTPKDVSYAVKTAKNISYTGFLTPPPYIPNILCMYNVSGLDPNYSCLPKFCHDRICMVSNKTCRCMYEPCSLYYAIEYNHKN